MDEACCWADQEMECLFFRAVIDLEVLLVPLLLIPPNRLSHVASPGLPLNPSFIGALTLLSVCGLKIKPQCWRQLSGSLLLPIKTVWLTFSPFPIICYIIIQGSLLPFVQPVSVQDHQWFSRKKQASMARTSLLSSFPPFMYVWSFTHSLLKHTMNSEMSKATFMLWRKSQS